MSTQSNVERTLYGFWLSPYMSQVAHFLSETGLTYRYERVSPFQGSTLTPEHIERNPLGKIPTLRDVNGVDISESHAICRYLARIYPEARKFYPIDDPMLCAEVRARIRTAFARHLIDRTWNIPSALQFNLNRWPI